MRALMPDYLRIFALFGIVIVNVQYIAFPAVGSFADPSGETAPDAITLWLVNGLALLKTYGLFSFVFGVGLGFLMRSAARRGLPFGRLYRNRMIGLLILGIAHGCLFFPGDILTIYAITGSILSLFRDWPVRRLVRVGAALLVLQALIAPPLLLAAPPTALTRLSGLTPAHFAGVRRKAILLGETDNADAMLRRLADEADPRRADVIGFRAPVGAG